MIVDQDAINQMLQQALDRAEGAQNQPARGGSKRAEKRAAAAIEARAEPALGANAPPGVRRLLKLRVPLRVILAERPLRIGKIRQFSLGLILEFERSIEHPLALCVANRVIGEGDAVKVGDRFGLRIDRIEDAATRIRSLGG